MKKKVKRWITLAVITVALGFVGLNVVAYNHAWAMTRFTTGGDRTSQPDGLGLMEKVKVLSTGVNVPRPSGNHTPSDLDPDAVVLKVHGSDGIVLETWYRDLGATSPLVILFHGYAAEKSSLLPEARALLKLGVSVMLVGPLYARSERSAGDAGREPQGVRCRLRPERVCDLRQDRT